MMKASTLVAEPLNQTAQKAGRPKDQRSGDPGPGVLVLLKGNGAFTLAFKRREPDNTPEIKTRGPPSIARFLLSPSLLPSREALVWGRYARLCYICGRYTGICYIAYTMQSPTQVVRLVGRLREASDVGRRSARRGNRA